jgi:hypothetical protein
MKRYSWVGACCFATAALLSIALSQQGLERAQASGLFLTMGTYI